MPNVFDNITTPFLENDAGNGLKDALKVALRGDFCVGYFNLRGSRCIDSVVNAWTLPSDEGKPPPCRLLVGMQRLPQKQLRAWLSDSPERAPDLGQLAKMRKDAAKEFRKQLTVGYPTDADEAGLKRLVKQLREKRLVVKLFLKHALHAKLYLAHRNDGFNPIIAYLGSSNLTMAGLKGQGELNVDVLDGDAAGKLHQWFLDRWDDSRCLDISEDLIEVIEQSWASERLLRPYHLHPKIGPHSRPQRATPRVPSIDRASRTDRWHHAGLDRLLREVFGNQVTQHTHGVTDAQDRLTLGTQIDALGARLHDLTTKELRPILTPSFSLRKASDSKPSTPTASW